MNRSARCRFDNTNRLPDAASFDRVFEQANRSRDKWFTILSRTNDRDVARLGLAISKKNCRQANQRNRIKRIVRESFRQHQQALTGLDVVVMNKALAASATNGELFASLAMHWHQCAEN